MEPQLCAALLTHLESWDNPNQEQGNRSNTPFVDEQQQIRWEQMLAGCVDLTLLARAPGTSMAMNLLPEIKQAMDSCPHTKIIGCLVGHVGTVQQ